MPDIEDKTTRQRLHDLANSLQSLATQNARQTAIMEAQSEDLAAINYTLAGNGTPGLIKLVDRHDQTLGRIGKAFWIIVTSAVGIILTGAVWVAKTTYAADVKNHQPTTQMIHYEGDR